MYGGLQHKGGGGFRGSFNIHPCQFHMEKLHAPFSMFDTGLRYFRSFCCRFLPLNSMCWFTLPQLPARLTNHIFNSQKWVEEG